MKAIRGAGAGGKHIIRKPEYYVVSKTVGHEWVWSANALMERDNPWPLRHAL